MSTNRKFKIKTLTDNIYDFDVSESVQVGVIVDDDLGTQGVDCGEDQCPC